MRRAVSAPFLLPFLFPLLVITGYLTHQFWTFQTVIWIYLLGPFVDVLLGADTTTRVSNDEIGGFWRFILWLWIPAEAAILLCGLLATAQHFSSSARAWQLLISVAIGCGTAGGMFGVTIAHELLHRASRFERSLAAALMTLLNYPHFCIEHLHGHHRNVGTPADPATARLGESIYAFYARSVSGGLRSAWCTEASRLRAAAETVWHPRNRMLRYGLSLLALYAVIAGFFGWPGVVFFVLQGLVAFSIFEAINYVEHYGLTRREIAPGRYQPVGPEHSWNSSHRFTNWLLFNVARHSDHHCEAGRNYLALRHCDDAPQLPAGYFAMFVLALFPPLWRQIMDPLATTRKQISGDAEMVVAQ